MKFKATKIATAVAAGLGLSMVGMNAAKADSILFPHFVLSDNVTTILSVINDDFSILSAQQLHYRYYFKDGSKAKIEDPCQEYDFWNPTSSNDVVTFDLGAHFGDDAQGVLFEPSRTTAVYKDDFASLGRGGRAPTRGYVLVDNSPFNPGELYPVPTAQLAGEAIIIDITSGSAWGYQAYNPAGIWGYTVVNDLGRLVHLNPYDFSDRVETSGEVLVPTPASFEGNKKNNFWVPIAVMPWDLIPTALLVTAVSENMGTNGKYDVKTKIGLRATAAGPDRVMFNRDERAYSGAVDSTINCVGRVEVKDMVAETVLGSTPQGGWTNVVVLDGQAIVFKAEVHDEGTFEGKNLPGTFNNIYQLRKGYRESMGRPFRQVGTEWNELPTFAVPLLDASSPYAVFNQTSIPSDPYDSDYYADPDDVRAAVMAGRVYNPSAAQ